MEVTDRYNEINLEHEAGGVTQPKGDLELRVRFRMSRGGGREGCAGRGERCSVHPDNQRT